MSNDDRNRKAAVLKQSIVFQDLAGEELEALVEIAVLKKVPEGTLIYRQASSSEGMYIINSGQVKIFHHSPEGKEYIIHVLGSGRTFAEAALFGKRHCFGSARAMAESELLFLPAEKLLPLLQSDSKLCLQLLSGMSTWICQLHMTLENIVLRDSLGRLADYLLSLTDSEATGSVTVKLPIKKRDLASHLALTPETLSRTLARLCELDAVRQIEGGEIEVRSIETLRNLAEA